MDKLIAFITNHAAHAHWFVFGALLLAGMNVPISTDVLLITCAILAATVVPENTLLLFSTIFVGSCCSACIAYWIGRKFGTKLLKLRYFKKVVTEEKLEKVKNFYGKYGFLTLLFGRFIPFGVRNCIFMSTGLSKFSFKTFFLRDVIACFIWSSLIFSLFYFAGQNHQALYQNLKIVLLSVVAALAVTVITIIWYKRSNTTCEK